MVMLLPARGQVPGKAITGVLARESRYAVIEAGHRLVPELETDAAIRSVADGEPDNADEFSAMAAPSHADWVVVPKILPFPPGYGLELTAYQSSSGRTETVVREIETAKIHQQVLEMVKLLLRPEGLGTDPLPWEKTVKPSSGRASEREESEVHTTAPGSATNSASDKLGVIVGLGAGAAACVSSARSDRSASVLGEIVGGWRFRSGLALQVDFRAHRSTDIVLQGEVAGRYLVPVTSDESLAVGAEAAVGTTLTTPRAFTLRASPVIDFGVTDAVHLQATVGDATWFKMKDASAVFVGGTLRGVLRF